MVMMVNADRISAKTIVTMKRLEQLTHIRDNVSILVTYTLCLAISMPPFIEYLGHDKNWFANAGF
jgi:hypothetical protein